MPSPTSSNSVVPETLQFHFSQVHKSSGKIYPFYPLLSPAEDSYLLTQYTARNIVQRKKNQTALRELLNITNALPLVGIMMASFNGKQKAFLEQLVEASCNLPVQLVIIANTKECVINKKSSIKRLNPDQASCHLFFGSADILVLPPDQDDALLAACFRYGLVPVTHNSQSLVRDYDPVSEEGNAFTYINNSIWSLYAALVRAVETHKLSYDWNRIQRNGMDMT